MQHPRPKPGARGWLNAGKSFGDDAPASSKSRAPIQARPLGPRPRPALRRARFARSMVFEEFRYKHARAIDYDDFIDRRPNQAPRPPRRWRASP